MISLLSSRKIGNIEYVLANISYKYNDDINVNYRVYLVTPLLILWVCIMPLVLVRKLHSNRDNLKKSNVKTRYGFLYKEY